MVKYMRGIEVNLLHIGNDIILRKKDIIGIFNLDNLKKNKNFNNLYKEKLDKNQLVKFSEKQEKSLIIVEKNKEILWYVSNINSSTLEKRYNIKKYRRV